MALVEDVIFSDPVLQQICFDKRRFAARSDYSDSEVSGLDMAISVDKVKLLKATSPALAEYWQRRMRARWFAIRKLCDGYHTWSPAAERAGCELVEIFEHDADSRFFAIDQRARAAYWYKYAQQPPPPWGELTYKTRRRGRRRRRRF